MILTILIIVLGIALAVVFLNRDKDEDKARLGILSLTVAIVVLAVLRLVLTARGPGLPQFDTALDRSLGVVAADRVAAVAEGESAVIIATLSFNSPYLAARLEGFQEQLATHNIRVLAVEDAHPQEIVGEGAFYPDSGLDARGIALAMERHPEADLFISLAGFPMHNLDEIGRDLQELEFFVFEDSTPHNWVGYLQHGVVDGLILQPLDSSWHDTSGSPDEIFDRRYVLVTQENLNDLRPRLDTGDSTNAW